MELDPEIEDRIKKLNEIKSKYNHGTKEEKELFNNSYELRMRSSSSF